MTEHLYTVAGLRVLSDLALPGLLPDVDPKVDDAPVDVTITRAALFSSDHDTDWEAVRDPHAELRFDIAGVMRMAMHQGRSISYDPYPGTAADDLALYLGGTGFGTLLHQRGLVVLHASAVRIGDAAILFCGPSGAGKSTLAAALVNAGHDHVADDFCAISFAADGTPMVAPDGRRHKLWDSAIAGLDVPDRQGDAVRSDMTKYYVDPRRTVRQALPIGAIVDLAVAEDHAITPLTPVEIVALLQANAYRPSLVAVMEQQRLYFEAAVRLAATSRFMRLSRPLDYRRLTDSLNTIKAALKITVA